MIFVQDPQVTNETRPGRVATALDTEFRRALGLYGSTMVVVAPMIGLGIFIVSQT